ncbi:MAG: peptide chain release factor 3 [Turneriella sp.]|nr:peptide chain release factor 3 [Leptospiraceae bacterium]MCX7633662.1 peptide chain release factor 3 [Turneriella sp.]
MDQLQSEIARRRAFAIIAHPDAGKTTLTEKLLLYGGAIHLAGHVRARKERRATRSDFMALEQERGISVSTAALQFEYDGLVMNLLDTPGHQDFSEDTYRTLMAVDSAIMLLDAARGVEPQTIKLFHICRERNLPIITFINKMDLPALEPFALLDNVEKVLGISAVPLVWPLGSGRDFKGFFNLREKTVHRFERTVGGAQRAPETVSGIDDPTLRQILGEAEYHKFCEDITLLTEVLPPFDPEKFLRGTMTPVIFGSAITNFGVDYLLKQLKTLAPPPRPLFLDDGSLLSPTEPRFTGFVFKLQANMNKLHRDRVAFVRITSGRFERGMSVQLPRLKKEVKLASSVAFFGEERNTIDEAYAGDIIGIISPGLYRLGDILCQGDAPALKPLPRFAPEIFARIVLEDTSKAKQFRKGIAELTDEGVVQLFNLSDASPIIGAVGQLQLDVFRYRMADEYGAPVRLENLPYACSRWIAATDITKAGRFDKIVYDDQNRPVILFESTFRLRSFSEEHPEVVLHNHPPD